MDRDTTVCGSPQGSAIVSAVDNGGFCVGEVKVDEKSNEITAIPELLKQVNVKDAIVTIDAAD